MLTLILLTVFLGILFLLLLYIPSTEGFANPVVEVYDFKKFFEPYPLDQICPIYDVIYQAAYKPEKVDAKGGPVPDDIASQKTRALITKDLSGAVFSCPFIFPKETDLDTVHGFVKKLDELLLVKAFRMLLYCKGKLTGNLAAAQKSIADIPKKEGFITECSIEELVARDFVPLQCIDPANEKGDEQDAIKEMDPVVVASTVQKKKEITAVLKKMALALEKAYPAAKRPKMAILIKECNEIHAKLLDLQNKLQSGQIGL